MQRLAAVNDDALATRLLLEGPIDASKEFVLAHRGLVTGGLPRQTLEIACRALKKAAVVPNGLERLTDIGL